MISACGSRGPGPCSAARRRPDRDPTETPLANEESNDDPRPRARSPRRRDGKAATQERILTAATRLFLHRGFERTSVTQVATAAGVSRGTVFWHFSDKETLFRAACKRFLAPFREALGGRLSHLPPRKRLSELFTVYEAFVDLNRSQIEAFVRWVLDSPVHSRVLRDDLLSLHETFRDEVRGAVEQIVTDPGEAAQLADGMLSLLDGNLLLKIFGAGTPDDERLRAGLAAVARRTFGTPEGG